ncbi:MAG: (d)CMP kinase [Rhodospirillaceae bacterium]|jgi:cytidylate kinase|nr:(d)CMP kinase [Rhodospirillaceae bacterium]MBT7266764.1 (d)CMP kinase [Rhodospirillaceae bacterium]
MLIAVDGPAAAGKGTLTRKLAEHFDLARLDTGLIYRAVGLKALELGDPSDEKIAVAAAEGLSFSDLDLAGLRDEAAGNAASKVAAIPAVRDILLIFQRNFAANPPNGKKGAVLDGRDIGTVVCPEAPYKLFIDASAEVRADRRYKELQERGDEAIRSAILRDIIDRDERDRSRTVAPLEPAKDAKVLDTSDLDADAVFAAALNFISLQD